MSSSESEGQVDAGCREVLGASWDGCKVYSCDALIADEGVKAIGHWLKICREGLEGRLHSDHAGII